MTIPATLQQALSQDRLAHAYLFYGRRCDTFDRVVPEFFRYLVCTEVEDGSCGDCQDCRQINSLNFADLVAINPPEGLRSGNSKSARSNVGVDKVREEVVGAASLTASQSPYKLFWLNNMSQFTTEASNSLLKVLEEPPGETVFVLTARSLGDCLPTIRSRCQWIRLQPETLDDGNIKDTCQALWPNEDWAQRDSNGQDDNCFNTWRALLMGDQRSSDIDWTKSNARGFLTYLFVLIHRKYTKSLPDELSGAMEPVEYDIVPDILERFNELEKGGQPLFVINSLLEKIHFPGKTTEWHHAI